MFSEFESLINIIDRFFPVKENRIEPEVSISTKFVQICEAHGVCRNQIPQIFKNLSYNDVQSDVELLKKIDDDIIIKACSLFGVNRSWFEGADDQIYKTYDFYKNPYSFKEFLSQLPIDQLEAVLLSPVNKDYQNPALILIQETIDYIDGSPYYRYYLCNNWDFSYWKSRVYLTACISLSWANELFVWGLKTHNEFIRSIEYGRKILNFGKNGIYSIDGVRWYADDMVITPELFLEGIRKDSDNFGYIESLKSWLKYESDGLMNTGVNKKTTKSEFIKALKKYTN